MKDNNNFNGKEKTFSMKITCYLGEEEVESNDYDKETIYYSDTLKHLLEDCEELDVIPPIPFQKKVVDRIFTFCSSNFSEPKDFFNIPSDELFELTNACNYLGIEKLLPMCLQEIAYQIRGKSPQELREFFKVENDLTPEMEEKIRKENEWIYS